MACMHDGRLPPPRTQVGANMRGGVIDKSQFKIVYVAPMKALAAEVTATFSKRLSALGALRSPVWQVSCMRALPGCALRPRVAPVLHACTPCLSVSPGLVPQSGR